MSKKKSYHLEFPEVVVVEASAGSGKTYALAKRYLQLLINPSFDIKHILLRSILAITFTNKATIEMKERILELLKRIALDKFSSKEEEADIFELLNVDKKFAKLKAGMIMDSLINHYNFFQVQTIDSFINALLLGFALNIDRSVNFKIKRDYADYLSYCLDLVIEEAITNKDVYNFLEEFLEHYLFVENRTGWFPREDILGLVRSLFRLTNKYGLPFKFCDEEAKDVIKKKKFIFSQIKQLLIDAPGGLNKTAYNSIEKFINRDSDIFEIKSLPSKFKLATVPMNKGSIAPLEYRKRWANVHKSIRALVELDSNIAYKPYLKLFSRLLDFLQNLSRKENILFLEELNREARFLFDDAGITVAEIYYRLATRFKHYLIDEFQDTSVLQWRNLELMVEEALSSGGSLFYVGDKKQAIYRFRGGEAKLFDEVRDGFNHFNVRLNSLTKNWRSQKEIVDFNNTVFSKDNLSRALSLSGITKKLEQDSGAVDEIVSIFKDASQQYKKQNSYGYVYIERIDEKNQQERDQFIRSKLLELLKDLTSRFRAQDIAILCRDNREVELVTSWLLENGFSVESEKTLNVIENPLIKELVSFLTFLHSPIDNLSFASFILGDIFTQKTGLSYKEISDFIFALHKEGKLSNGSALYRIFRDKFPKIWEQYFDEFFRSVGLISPYELVTSIYQNFGVMDNFSKYQAFFMKFLELIKTKEDECIGLEALLIYLNESQEEDLYVNITHSNSIKVLTIHKSKGLEFGVVIIPFLRIDIDPVTGERGTNSYVVETPGQDLKLIRITEEHRAYSPVLQKIYAQSYKKACIDELNNIYVALTRAQFELYIFLPKKSGSAKNKACFFIPDDFRELGTKRKYERKKQSINPQIEITPSRHKNWLRSLREEFGDADQIKNRDKILQGDVFHLILSQIGNCMNLNLDQLVIEACAYASNKYPLLKDFYLYEAKIKELLQNKKTKDIFYVPDGEVFCEKEIVNQFGDLKRIDRLIVEDKHVSIVEYKLSQDKRGQYHKQVAEYMQAAKDIYPGRCIRGLFLYLDTIALEEVKQ